MNIEVTGVAEEAVTLISLPNGSAFNIQGDDPGNVCIKSDSGDSNGLVFCTEINRGKFMALAADTAVFRVSAASLTS